ncbi:hypothetical protein [Stenotrophomonas sp. AB1(2024)]|uniref:hypothetical protein n=1 Tax=Stenotrophomonas sp. AB1(2024) TaxID=3132215 RepID=UPI0030A1479F
METVPNRPSADITVDITVVHNRPDTRAALASIPAPVASLPELPRIELPDIHAIRRDIDSHMQRGISSNVCRAEFGTSHRAPPTRSLDLTYAFTRIDQAKTLEEALPAVNVLLRAGGCAPRAIPNGSHPGDGAGTMKQSRTPLELQRDAAGDPAKERVLAGEPVDKVARVHGIEKGSGPYRMLEHIAVEGPAKARIMAGEPVDKVARVHGTEKGSGPYRMLEHIAVEGPAKARIMAGEPVDKVARAHGMENGSGPYRMLEYIAVEGPAKARIAAGEPIDAVAAAHGIAKGSSAYLTLERML